MTTTNQQPVFSEIAPTTQVAMLPYLPLWAAAQFASCDEAKGVINFIHIRIGEDGECAIEATDGHRLLRHRFQLGDQCHVDTSMTGGQSLLIHPKDLRKFVRYGRFVSVSFDLRLEILGGKGEAMQPLVTLHNPHFFGVTHASDSRHMEYPNIPQLIPESFSNAPGGSFAFNARYVKEWCSVVEKWTDNNVTRVECNAPTTPFIWSAKDSENGELEYLLMPVQVRN